MNWGRPRDDIYGQYDYGIHNAGQEPVTHTQVPTVTGTSVIGIKYNNGVIIAADNLASYGSLRRFIDQERIITVGKNTAVGIGGDTSDLQTLQEILQKLEIEESYDDPTGPLTTPTVHSYLQKVMYHQRSQLDPYWNALLVAGLGADDEPYLAYVDLLGVTYKAPAVATGFGSYLAVPLLRRTVEDEKDVAHVTEEQARNAIDEAMKVLFYRDGRALDKYTVATISKSEGVRIEKDVRCKNMNWKMAEQVKGFGSQQQA